jgi:hypothetical protein
MRLQPLDHPRERDIRKANKLLRALRGGEIMTEPKLFDVVALQIAVPQHGLQVGQVGTIVETLAAGVFEVEFSDLEGRTYATVALPIEALMRLHYEPAAAD